MNYTPHTSVAATTSRPCRKRRPAGADAASYFPYPLYDCFGTDGRRAVPDF